MALTYDSNLPLPLIGYQIEDVLPRLDVNEWTLVQLLKKESTPQRRIEFPLNVGGAASNTRKVGDVVSPQASSTKVVGSLEVGEHVIDHTMTILDVHYTEAVRRGKLAVNDLFRMKTEEGILAILRKLGELVYTGTGNDNSAGIYGLNEIIEATSYAGVSSVTYPMWKGYESTAAEPRKLNRALLQQAEIGIADKRGRTTAIVTTKAVEETMKSIYQNLGIYQLGPSSGNLGLATITYQGLPVYTDVNCPSNRLYMLNLNNLALKFFDYRLAMHQEMASRMQIVVVEGIPFVITNVTSPDRPEVYSYNIKIQPQLYTAYRQHQAVIKNLITDLELYNVEPQPAAPAPEGGGGGGAE